MSDYGDPPTCPRCGARLEFALASIGGAGGAVKCPTGHFSGFHAPRQKSPIGVGPWDQSLEVFNPEPPAPKGCIALLFFVAAFWLAVAKLLGVI